MTFRAFFKELRERAGLKKTDLARRSGVGLAYISQIESGAKQPPTSERLEKMADIMGVKGEDRTKLFNLAILERSTEESRGLVVRGMNRPPHSIELSEDLKDYVKIPRLGVCPASPKSWVPDEVESWHYLPKEIIRGRKLYILAAKGDSMNKAGIDNGDLVLVDSAAQVENGNIVIVCIDGEYTMKRFFRHENQVTLMPDSTNGSHAPSFYDMKKIDVVLRGVVVGVYLKMVR